MKIVINKVARVGSTPLDKINLHVYLVDVMEDDVELPYDEKADSADDLEGEATGSDYASFASSRMLIESVTFL